MKIILNGKKKYLKEKISVKNFLENLEKINDINLSGAVILIDNEIIKKGDWENFFITDGNVVEVLSFVSGG